jgi:hypothetical protein
LPEWRSGLRRSAGLFRHIQFWNVAPRPHTDEVTVHRNLAETVTTANQFLECILPLPALRQSDGKSFFHVALKVAWSDAAIEVA